MNEEATPTKEPKPSRGNYFVVHSNTSPVTQEFRTKREMYEWLKSIQKKQVIAIFKGRKLEISVKQIYSVD